MSEDEAASPADVEAAIRALAPGDLRRLESYAQWRMRGLGGRWRGMDDDDLLAEAIALTLAGAEANPDDDSGTYRRWYKRVGFVQHLLGAMRSISTHWAERKGRGDEVPLSGAPGDEGDEEGAEERVASDDPTPDRQVIARMRLEEVESCFSEDAEVLDVIDGLRAELSGPDIQELLGISETEYWTRMRRMRRILERRELRGGADA